MHPFLRKPVALFVVISSCTIPLFAQSQKIENALVVVTLAGKPMHWSYQVRNGGERMVIQAPVFEVDGKAVSMAVRHWTRKTSPVRLRNGATEYRFSGTVAADSSLHLNLVFRMAPDNPVVRFQYVLCTSKPHRLTKTNQRDSLTYVSTSLAQLPRLKEVRFSEFNEKFHATHRTEYALDERAFDDRLSVMGPMLVMANDRTQFLLAYEHGSQFPDRFLEFDFRTNRSVGLRAVRANYLTNQPLTPAQPYQTLWFEIAGVAGTEDDLAAQYRMFALRYLSENLESRKPYIFYNTWGRQERVKWAGGTYLQSMNLAQTLLEIDRAAELGVEVFVIDTGWFLKSGDWTVNPAFFPDTLRQVKARLNQHGMKLGLWFSPLFAAQSSQMLARNRAYQTVRNGKPTGTWDVWNTESSTALSLVSPYWEDYANAMSRLVSELGVTYFKWDAMDQYGSEAAGHFHGTTEHTARERLDSYAFQQPIYMTKVVDKVSREHPETIFDFDVTEDGRCVGLQFLSSGKYFIMNNGPYYHNFDLGTKWKTPLANENSNVFVNPGPARGWYTRSVLDYDKWLPSVLFLTHYQPDEPRNSQLLNVASLILGQNGIWGEILKTSPEGVRWMGQAIGRYKQVRDDITLVSPVVVGETGGSPEIHEKINPANGKGAVVLFANHPGTYTYVTKNRVHKNTWQTDNTGVKIDKKGRAVIRATFTEASASIVYFGVSLTELK